MNHRTHLRRTAATATVVALAASALLGTDSPARAADPDPAPATYPAATHGATVDWFDDRFPALDPGSVFETVTFERFEYLLKKNTGRWAFVIGGAEDDYLQDTIGAIQDVAEAEGIERIYNFDPNLDGEALSVFDLTGYELASADNAGKDQFLDLGERLVTSYLGKDAETPFTVVTDPARPDQRVSAEHPYLFVYDAAGGDSARIVDALVTPPADLASPPALAAYKTDVKRVLTSAPLDVDTQWDFLSTEHNRRHYERYVKNADPATEALNRKRFGGDVFDAAKDLADGDEDDFRIQSVTYPELIDILDSEGDFLLLFGGTWCHNTAAIIQQTAEYARRYGIRKVYNFDFSLDSTGNAGSLDKHIRDNAFRTVGGAPLQTRPSHLYGRILERLSNAQTQYRITADEPGTQSTSPVKYYADGVVTDPANPATGEKLARKIQVGHLLSYDKDASAGGQSAPVLDQAIRDGWTNPAAGDPPAAQFAGNVEYMTEVWFTQGKDDAYDAADPDRLRGNVNVSAEAGQNSLRNQRNFAREAIDEIRDVIAGVGGGYDSALTVSGAPATVPAANPGTLTAQVAVDSTFSGFFSDRTAGATLAPLTGRRPVGGSVQVYLDGAKLGEVDVAADRVAAVSLPLPALAVGQHSVRYVYGGGAAGLVGGSERTQPLTVQAASTPIGPVAVSGASLGITKKPTSKKAGTAQVTIAVPTGQPAATGTVKVVLKKGAVKRTVKQAVVNGVATVKLPKLAKGRWKVSVKYSGDAGYLPLTSAAKAIKVAK
ncbi:Ig-like domain-containing protein [Nocardioides carbamazepini]|uniref:Ig-like domain-containing protein n=1 Tax=Nocardioides carbamazepini TaxID=2854259 RepID=UPI002149BADD|nr:Ig-like domain-containing protein [Nocardioides carbamazepini]MCR1781496.1 Ig-like domain-containing protein [Nocardioides carbamazepini]